MLWVPRARMVLWADQPVLLVPQKASKHTRPSKPEFPVMCIWDWVFKTLRRACCVAESCLGPCSHMALRGSRLGGCDSSPRSTGTVWQWTPGNHRCLEFPQLVTDIHILVSIFVATENIIFTYEHWRHLGCTVLVPLYVTQFLISKNFKCVFQWDLDWSQVFFFPVERKSCFSGCSVSYKLIVTEVCSQLWMGQNFHWNHMWRANHCHSSYGVHIFMQKVKKSCVFLKQRTRLCENVCTLHLIELSFERNLLFPPPQFNSVCNLR